MNIKTDRILSGTIFILALLIVSSMGAAQKYQQAGDYNIHYIAYKSSFLAPEVARIYGITRGGNIGIVNVSVQEGDVIAGGIAAEVSGSANNMIQQVKYLEFDEIREGKAVYYISSFKFDNEDSLTFKLKVTIKETGKIHEIKWQQMFWED